jgi:hypothetical protein
MNHSINGMLSDMFYIGVSSFIGLKSHLMRLFPAHYRLYEVLVKESRPPTTDELEIIQGRKAMDKLTAEQYCEKLDNISNNIRDMLERQAATNQVQLFFFIFILVSTFLS